MSAPLIPGPASLSLAELVDHYASASKGNPVRSPSPGAAHTCRLGPTGSGNPGLGCLACERILHEKHVGSGSPPPEAVPLPVQDWRRGSPLPGILAQAESLIGTMSPEPVNWRCEVAPEEPPPGLSGLDLVEWLETGRIPVSPEVAALKARVAELEAERDAATALLASAGTWTTSAYGSLRVAGLIDAAEAALRLGSRIAAFLAAHAVKT